MKRLVVIFCLVAVCEGADKQIGKNITYPLRNTKGILLGVINAREMRMRADGIIDIKDLVWETQDADGRPVLIEASACRINNKQKVISSESDVVVKRDNMKIEGRGYICELDTRRLIILNDVRVVLLDLKLLKGP